MKLPKIVENMPIEDSNIFFEHHRDGRKCAKSNTFWDDVKLRHKKKINKCNYQT